MSAFKYQWNQTIDVGTAGLLSKQWTSIRHILSLLVTANACVHVTAYVAVRRSLSTTYTAVVLGLLLRQYVSYQFGVWAAVWVQIFGLGGTPLPTSRGRTPPGTGCDNVKLFELRKNGRAWGADSVSFCVFFQNRGMIMSKLPRTYVALCWRKQLTKCQIR